MVINYSNIFFFFWHPQTRETMVKEALALRESLNILRGKNEKLEAASKELDKSRQVNNYSVVLLSPS